MASEGKQGLINCSPNRKKVLDVGLEAASHGARGSEAGLGRRRAPCIPANREQEVSQGHHLVKKEE